MISVELAKKLKDAGLVWEPKEGDRFYSRRKIHLVTTEEFETSDGCIRVPDNDGVFLCTLPDLLAELEARGYGWTMYDNDPIGGYRIRLYNNLPHGYLCKHEGGTPEEAAGRAVLWVLEQGKGERE